MRLARLLFSIVAIVMLTAGPAVGQMPTTVKNSTLREGNPKGAKERLIIPYLFPSETMGLTAGVGGMVKGYGQDQLMIGATAFASSDDLENKEDAAGVIAGMWDWRLPYTQRFFLTVTGAVGYFPLKGPTRHRHMSRGPRGRGATIPMPINILKLAATITGPTFAWNTSCPSGRPKNRP